MKLKMIDLFAGTGAFSHSFESTNKIEVVFANDILKHSKQIYEQNLKHKLTLLDINELNPSDIPSHDIITAGFPCQPFSIAGKKLGFEDNRSNVFFKIMEIVDYHKPKILIFENVKNLLTHDNGNSFKIIQEEILKRNYNIIYNIIDTSKITGIPQHRERIYIICTLEKLPSDFLRFQEKELFPITNFLEDFINEKYFMKNSKNYEIIKKEITKKNTFYQFRRTHVRENMSGLCPTLTENMGSGGCNVPLILDPKLTNEFRKLTPRETFSLQGFPKTYNFGKIADSNLYKLSGNSITYTIGKMIAERIVDYFCI